MAVTIRRPPGHSALSSLSRQTAKSMVGGRDVGGSVSSSLLLKLLSIVLLLFLLLLLLGALGRWAPKLVASGR